MDKINLQNVIGTFIGKVGGPGVIHQVPGIDGQALSLTHDTYIDYGILHHSTCFHLPENCAHGVTFSMWLWLRNNMTGSNNVIITTNGKRDRQIGYKIKYKADENVLLIKLTTNTTAYSNEIYVVTGKWIHIAFTWYPLEIMQVFVNGCPSLSVFKMERTARFGIDNFIVGSDGIGKAKTATMTIDELYVWYHKLAHKQIWRLYVVGL